MLQPISHQALLLLIRSHMERRNLRLAIVAERAGVKFETLAIMFAGQAFFNIRVLASLGKALEVDFSLPTAQYALWRYNETLAELKQPQRASEKKPGQYGQDDLSPLARSIVAEYPGASTQLLIQHLMASVPGLFEPIAETAIRKAQRPNERTGDYDAA